MIIQITVCTFVFILHSLNVQLVAPVASLRIYPSRFISENFSGNMLGVLSIRIAQKI
jgi:hypothetical protein